VTAAVHRWFRRMYQTVRHTIHKFGAFAHLYWALGLLVFNPGLIEDVPALAPMALIAPSSAWGLWSALLGLLQVAGLGGFGLDWRRERLAEMAGAYLSAMWWGWIVCLFMIHGGWTTAESTYLAVFTMSVWALRYVPLPPDWKGGNHGR
jgi:hypothetical protein